MRFRSAISHGVFRLRLEFPQCPPQSRRSTSGRLGFDFKLRRGAAPETDPGSLLQRTLSLANAEQQMLPNDGDCLSVAEVGALLKVMELCTECAKQFVVGKLAHNL